MYMCTQRELCMSLAYTEWKKVVTMNTDGCVAFSSNVGKNDVGLCVFQQPATGVDAFHL